MKALGNSLSEIVRKRKLLDREGKLKLALYALPEAICDDLSCTFAGRALPTWEAAFPNIALPRRALSEKRKWLNGEISDEELQSLLGEVSEFYYQFLDVGEFRLLQASYLRGASHLTPAQWATIATLTAWGLSFDHGPQCVLSGSGVIAECVAGSARRAMSPGARNEEYDWQLGQVRAVLLDPLYHLRGTGLA